MTASSPQTLVDLLSEVARTAADAAAAESGAVGDIIDQALASGGAALQQVEAMPGEILTRLRKLVDPPDWFSLLVFGLMRISDLDPNRLSVGALAAAGGWSKAVTLTFTAGGAKASLALALSDPGKNGVILRTSDAIAADLGGGGPLRLHIESSGAGEWRIPVRGSFEPPQVGAVTAEATVRVELARHVDPVPGLTLSIGSLHGKVSLNSAQPVWTLSAGLGDPGAAPGIGVSLTPAAILGPLSSVVEIGAITESYSPSVAAAAGASPTLDLGHRGL